MSFAPSLGRAGSRRTTSLSLPYDVQPACELLRIFPPSSRVNKGATTPRPARLFGSISSRYCLAPFGYFSFSFQPRSGLLALRSCLGPRAGQNRLDTGHRRPQLAQVVLSQVALSREESHTEYLL